MDTKRWKQVKSLFNRALKQDRARRMSFLKEACEGDDDILQEVVTLLEADETPHDILTGHAGDFFHLPDRKPVENERVGRYRIIRPLGSGGMGDVYLAEDTDLDRRVALKFLPFALANDEKFRNRLVREAKAAARLNHPCIVTVYEVGEHAGLPYIAMEYVAGRSLQEYAGNRQLSIERIEELAIDLCRALSAAHKAGVIHRDIKPANIIINREGKPLILDFGLAFFTDSDTLTRTGSTLGTVAYMSPEQIEGGTVDARSDLFSLGIVLYELIAGDSPFRKDNIAATMQAILNEKPVPPLREEEIVPDYWKQIVLKLLEKKKTLRQESAEAVIADIEQKAVSGLETEDGGISAPISVETKKTLAVLPFENLGDAADGYFADGIADEISSRLASSRYISVISRTTTRQYKNTEKDIHTIAEEINVDFILEGSIRWDKSAEIDRIRISARFIQVTDDRQLWAGTFQENIENIFAVQENIAVKIAEALDLTLKEQNIGLPAKQPTHSLAAYQAYLRGMDYLHRVDNLEEDLRMALQLFERSVRLDPEFATAHAEISQAYSALYHYACDRSQNCKALAYDAAQKALALDPDLPESRLALGAYRYWIEGEYKSALEELSIAEEGLPNNIRVKWFIAAILIHMGDWASGLQKRKELVELSPRDPLLAHDVAFAYLYLRNNEEANVCYSQSIALNPDQEFAYVFSAWNQWHWRGDIKAARSVLDELPKSRGSRTVWYWYIGYLQRLYEADYQGAIAVLSEFHKQTLVRQHFVIPKTRLEALAYELSGDKRKARKANEAARLILEKELNFAPEDHRLHGSLGVVYASLGHEDLAIQHGTRGMELCPLSRNVLLAPFRMEDMAQIYTLIGNHDGAIDHLAHLLSIPGLLSAPLLRIDPRWNGLRNHPRFQTLLDKYDHQKKTGSTARQLQLSDSVNQSEKLSDNPEANECYQRGLSYHNLNASQQELNLARTMYQKAVGLDPHFVQALAGLSEIYSTMSWEAWINVDDLSSTAKEYLERATALAPESTEVLEATGSYFFLGERDYHKALPYFEAARDSAPNRALIHAKIGLLLRRIGRWDDAIKALRHASSLDTMDARIIHELGLTVSRLHRYEEAIGIITEALDRAPDLKWAYLNKSRLQVFRDGNTDAAKKTLADAMANNQRWPGLTSSEAILDILERDYNTALNKLSSPDQAHLWITSSEVESWLLRSSIYRYTGNHREARENCERARGILDKMRSYNPSSQWYFMHLARVFAGLNRKSEALEAIDRSISITPVDKDSYDGPIFRRWRANILTKVGEYQQAIDEFEYLLSIPSDSSAGWLSLSPGLDPLREYKRWRDLMAKYGHPIQKKHAKRQKARAGPLDRQDARSDSEKLSGNPEANDFYRRGNGYHGPWSLGANLRSAETMYLRAIELDPGFAMAYIKLGEVHTERYWRYEDYSDRRLAAAKDAIDKALSINAELSEAYEALGHYYLYGYRDYNNALKQFQRALEIQPENGSIYNRIGCLRRRQGNWQEAIENLEKAAALNPRDDIVLLDLAHSLMLIRDYEESDELYKKAIELTPDYKWAYILRSLTHIRWNGDIASARKCLKEALSKNDRWPGLTYAEAIIDCMEGDYNRALKRMTFPELAHFYKVTDEGEFWILKGDIFRYKNDKKSMIKCYESALKIFKDRPISHPNDFWFHAYMGKAYAGLGRKEEALRQSRLATQQMPVKKDAVDGTIVENSLADVYTLIGEYDLALDKLGYLLSIPSELSINWLKLHPEYAPLRNHPRFKALLEKYDGGQVAARKSAITASQPSVQDSPEAGSLQNRAIVMRFENLNDTPAHSHLGYKVVNRIVANLAKTKYIDIISYEEVHSALINTNRTFNEAAIDQDILDIAAKNSSRWIVTGNIIQANPVFTLSSQIIEVLTGRILATQEIKTHPGDTVIEAADRLAAVIKRDLLRELSSDRVDDARFDRVTTSSSEARAHYKSGVISQDLLNYPEAEQRFTKAIDLDADFAMAYYRLALIRRHESWHQKSQYIEKAIRLVDKVSELERLYIESLRAEIDGDLKHAIEKLNEILLLHPDEEDALSRMAVIKDRQQRYAESIKLYQQVLEINPLYASAWNMLAYVYDKTGDFGNSIQAINEYIELLPGEANPYDSRAEIYTWNNQFDLAIGSYKKALQADPDYFYSLLNLGILYMYTGNYDGANEMFVRLSRSSDESYRSIGRTWMAVVPLYQGRLQQALEISRSAIEEDASDNSPHMERADKHILRAGIFRERKNYDLALEEVKSAVELMETPISDAIRKRDELAAALADIGDFASAEKVLSSLKLNTDQIDPGFKHHYWFAAGRVDYKRKNYSKASDLFRKAISNSTDQEPYILFRAIYMLGKCYLESGRFGDAVEQFKLLDFRLGHHQLYWAPTAVKKHYYLGRAYEASGWKNHAEAEYNTFLEIWKNADPGIDEIDDASQRLAHLKSVS